MRYVESLNQSLHALMERDEKVIILGEDILDPYGGAFKVTKGLSTRFDDRVVTTPISEAGIIGVGTGFALRGFKPIVEIMFGDFLTLCADQIVNGAAKFSWMYNDQVTVPLVIRTPMGGRRGYGPTHSQSLERLFFGVTGVKIVAPSHLHSPGGLLESIVENSTGPTLFIENKKLYSMNVMKKGSATFDHFAVREVTNYDSALPTMSLSLDADQEPDVVLICYGGMAPFALEAAYDVFMNHEIVVEVLVPSSVKPLPIVDLLPSIEGCGRVVVCEEAPRTSGWGAEVSAQLMENQFYTLRKSVIRVSSKDVPIPSSMPLEEKVLSQITDIIEAVLKQVDID